MATNLSSKTYLRETSFFFQVLTKQNQLHTNRSTRIQSYLKTKLSAVHFLHKFPFFYEQINCYDCELERARENNYIPK